MNLRRLTVQAAMVGLLAGSVGVAPLGQVLTPRARAFEVAAVVHFPNGPVSTWDPHDALVRSPLVNDFYTVDSLCKFSDNPQRDSARLAYGWHVESHVLRASDVELVVRVTWKRTHDRGVLSSVGGAIDLTLKAGSRIEIDRILPGPPTSPAERSCTATAMSLEVRLPAARTN